MVACLLPHADPLHRVSVIPRGTGVGGMTLQLPREDKGLFTKKELLDRIAVLLGGRVAERLLFDDISTGAANDLQRVTEIAHRMVVEYGMSDRLGPVSLTGPNSPPLLRATADGGRAMSDDTAREVDLEVRRIADEQEERVTKLLTSRKRRLTAIARVLRSRETLDARAFKKLLDAPLKPREATR
jgi:cell division protease FtsH